MPIQISTSSEPSNTKADPPPNTPQVYGGWNDLLNKAPKNLDWNTLRVVKNGIVVYTPQMTPQERLAAVKLAHGNRTNLETRTKS